MMIVKKTLLMLALLLCTAVGWAEVSPGVTFLLKSGQKVSFAFSERPVIATSADAVSVSTGGVERVSYPYADVTRILFEESVVSAIELPAGEGKVGHVVFLIDGAGMHISGMKAGECVSVYSLAGARVLTAKASADGKAELEVSSLSEGLYMVRTASGISYKWLNR